MDCLVYIAAAAALALASIPALQIDTVFFYGSRDNRPAHSPAHYVNKASAAVELVWLALLWAREIFLLCALLFTVFAEIST